MPCPSLPIFLKFSTDVVWPVALLCSNIGDGAFKCSLYLSSKVLDDSPMYSLSHSVLPHLYQYMMLLCFFIPSLSFGNISKSFRVFPPLKYAWTLYIHTIQNKPPGTSWCSQKSVDFFTTTTYSNNKMKVLSGITHMDMHIEMQALCNIIHIEGWQQHW